MVTENVDARLGRHDDGSFFERLQTNTQVSDQFLTDDLRGLGFIAHAEPFEDGWLDIVIKLAQGEGTIDDNLVTLRMRESEHAQRVVELEVLSYLDEYPHEIFYPWMKKVEGTFAEHGYVALTQYGDNGRSLLLASGWVPYTQEYQGVVGSIPDDFTRDTLVKVLV